MQLSPATNEITEWASIPTVATAARRVGLNSFLSVFIMILVCAFQRTTLPPFHSERAPRESAERQN